jgi:hypothetical protein
LTRASKAELLFGRPRFVLPTVPVAQETPISKENQLVHERHLLWKENLDDMVPYSYTSFEIPIQVGKRLHIRTDLRSFIAGKFGHSKSPK